MNKEAFTVEAHALMMKGATPDKPPQAVTIDEIRRHVGGARLALESLDAMLDELSGLDAAEDRHTFADLAQKLTAAGLATLARMTPAPGNMVILREPCVARCRAAEGAGKEVPQ